MKKNILQTAIALLVVVSVTSFANAQTARQITTNDLQIVPVPSNPLDLTVPHLVYNGTPKTLKAIQNSNTIFSLDPSGNGIFMGGIIAVSFSGNGAGLTSLDALHLINLVPLANGGTNNNSFTAGKFLAYDGTKLSSTTYDQSSFAPAGGSNNYIQNQNASPQNASFNINGNAVVGGALNSASLSTGTVNATSGIFSNDLHSATLSTGTVNATSGTFSGTLSGDGSGLTNLNASSLTTGTVPVAALSGSYNINVSGSAASFTGTLAGDVTGTQSSTTVAKINGNTLGSTTPTAGNLLIANATQWVSTSLGGDAGLSSSGTLTLSTVNSNVGSFTNANITVDGKGRITAASNGAAGISGSGSTNTLPKFTSATSIGNSLASDNGAMFGYNGSNYGLGGITILHKTGTISIYLGEQAGSLSATAYGATGMGYYALHSALTGNQNTAIGNSAMQGFTNPQSNTAVGSSALGFGTSGDFNTAVGVYALVSIGSASVAGGNRNVGVGYQAGNYARGTGASDNVFVGYNSGSSGTAPSDGGQNTFIGSSSGITNTSGSSNTLLGYNANVGSNNLTNATAIGAGAIVSASNALVLGNNVNVGIGTSTPDTKLDVEGNIHASGTIASGASITLDGTSSPRTITGDASLNIITTTGDILLNPTGKVGIGTLTPHQKLEVNGAILATGAFAAPTGTGVMLYDNGAGTISAINNGNARDLDILGQNLVFETGSSYAEKMRLDQSGNLGIGMTPGQKLDVAGNVQFSGALMPNAIAGSSGQVLISQGAGVAPIWAAAGLSHITETFNTTAPYSTTSASEQLLATDATATDITIALQPKGNGALQAQTGGNIRGSNSVDLQMSRANSTQVASGTYSVIGGGQFNTASGGWSTVGGGYQSNATGGQATVAGGDRNSATGTNATVGGGSQNTASGGNSFVGGGSQNTAGGTSSWQVVAGGQNNQATNTYAVIGGGAANIASGTYTVIGGGDANTVSGNFSAIPGGTGMTISGTESFGFQSWNALGGHNMTIASSNTVVFGNNDLWLANNINQASAIKFFDKYNTSGAFPNTSKYVGFSAPDAVTTSTIWKLPVADGSSGQVMKTDGSGNLSWVTAGGLTNFTESVNTSAPNATIPVVRLLANNAATNVDVALSPKGNGGLAAQVADNATTGGNKRGINVVDWQMTRGSNTQVASGDYSVIGGGQSNAASGTSSVVGGGSGNTITSSSGTIAGGNGNTVSGTSSVVGGGTGNIITSATGTIAGGNGNTVSGTSSTIGGGANNQASNSESVVAGGYINQASNTYASVGGGRSNIASGDRSTIAGGYYNTTGGAFSTIPGGSFLTLSGHDDFGFFSGNNGALNGGMTIAANSVSVFGNTDLWLANNDNTARALYFYAPWNTSGAFPSTDNYVGFKAGAVTTSVIWTLPVADGSSGQLLKTDGSGNLGWVSSSSGWSLTGNAGTTPGTNFIGTTDNNDLVFKVNGNLAGRISTASKDNTSLGFHALGSIDNSADRSSTAFGSYSLSNMTTGTNNVAVGFNCNGAIDATDDIAIGSNALTADQHSGFNTAVGSHSLQQATTSGNVAVGYFAGFTATLSDNNTFLGSNTDVSASTGITNSTAIGKGAIITASNTIQLGNSSVTNVITSGGISAAGGKFAVDISGNITKINNVTTNFPASQGSANTYLKNDGSGNLSWATTGGGLTNFTESVNTSAPNATVPVVRLLATNAATDVDVVLSPKGNGGLAAQVADNATTGGNKRGIDVVDWQMTRTANTNVASGNYSVIGGGQSNTASGLASVVCGGGNDGMVLGNTASGVKSVVVGGVNNTASGIGSFVGGGGASGIAGNTASGNYAVIVSGAYNIASGGYSTIGGGAANQVTADDASIVGGEHNTASATGSFIGGGGGFDGVIVGNTANGIRSVVVGGAKNTSSGAGSFVGGGGYDGTTYSGNTASGTVSFVGGGFGNTASNTYASLLGGNKNTSSNAYSTVGGGNQNTASGNESTVGGGGFNTASSYSSVIAGGEQNTASTANYTTVGGGSLNTASALDATVSGGKSNRASGSYSMVPGGYQALASNYGQMAQASGNFTNQGDAQTSVFVARNQTTNATATSLFLDGSSIRIAVPSSGAMNFKVRIIGKTSGTAATVGSWDVSGAIYNNGGTATIVGTNVTTTYNTPAGWSAPTVGGNGANIDIQVTGATTTTIDWVARIETTEIVF